MARQRAGALGRGIRLARAAVEGNREEALIALRKAVSLRPESAEWASGDRDFEALWGDPEFISIVGP